MTPAGLMSGEPKGNAAVGGLLRRTSSVYDSMVAGFWSCIVYWMQHSRVRPQHWSQGKRCRTETSSVPGTPPRDVASVVPS